MTAPWLIALNSRIVNNSVTVGRAGAASDPTILAVRAGPPPDAIISGNYKPETRLSGFLYAGMGHIREFELPYQISRIYVGHGRTGWGILAPTISFDRFVFQDTFSKQ